MQSQDYVFSLINSLPSAIVIVDSNGGDVRWNDKAMKLSPIKSAEVKGKTLYDAFPEFTLEMINITKFIKT